MNTRTTPGVLPDRGHPTRANRTWSPEDIARALDLPSPTEEQRDVIQAPLRSLLVVAGAGSGKTETMSARVVWLVANGLVPPERILGLTFTRKAAGELAERIARRLRRLAEVGLLPAAPEGSGEEDALPTVSTYHAYAGGLVTEHGLRLGVEPDARLLTEAAAWQYAHEVVVRHDGPMDQVGNVESTVTAAVRDLAGQLAEHLRTPEDLRRYLTEVEAHVEALPAGNGRSRSTPAPVTELLAHVRAQRQLLPLLDTYARTKRLAESLDFADQMAIAARLAQVYPGVAAAERARYSVVLLDEFQDTSEAQMRLLHSLFADPSAGITRPVIAVGDPHQSIYGWRGASATTLAAFPERFALPHAGWVSTDPAAAGHPDGSSDRQGESDMGGPGDPGDPGDPGGPGDPDDPVASRLVPPVLPLSTSWRNDTAVLTVANTTAAPLAAQGPIRVEPLRAAPTAGTGLVEAVRTLTAADEAEVVADWIEARWWEPGSQRRPTGVSAAVLCRRRAQFAAVADALGARGIPVEVVGLGGLLTRPEVSDVVSLLRVVHDPSRGDALMRLLTGPYVRLGAADLDGLGAWSREMRAGADLGTRTDDDSTEGDLHAVGTGEGDAAASSVSSAPPEPEQVDDHDADENDEPSLVEAVDALPPEDWVGGQGQRLSATAYARLTRLSRTLDTVRAAVGHPLPELVVMAERALGLDVEVAAALDTLPQTARRHLDAFADAAAGFEHSADRPTLGGFLDWLDAARDEERGLDSPASHVSEGAVQVLTVHAAKGLEWDVVAIPGLVEAAFPSHRSYNAPKDGGLPTPSSKGWLTGLGSLPYDLRGDVAGLPALPWQQVADLTELGAAIKEFAGQGGVHALAEERRLAYVAFTRARHRLLLTASVWLEGASPRTPSRFLTELREVPGLVHTLDWAPDPEPDAVNPLLADSPAALWPQRPQGALVDADRRAGAWVRSVLQQEEEPGSEPSDEARPRDSLAETVEILLAESRRGRRDSNLVHLPGHLSTSALVELRSDPQGFLDRLRRPMPAPPARAARAGTAFHAWIEQHYRSASLVDDLDLDLPGEPDDLLEETDLETARRLFLDSPWAAATPLELEVSLETVVDGLPVRGRIDAVFPRGDHGVTIVDWKTGTRPSPGKLRARSLQLAVYRLAYARWRGLSAADVDAAFYFAATGETVYPPLPSEADIVDLIAGLDVDRS